MIMFFVMIKFYVFILAFSILFNSQVSSAEVIMPSALTANTSSFVLLSDSGTTPSINGYSGTLLVSAVASAGNIKITITSNILQAAGYCGYSSDGSGAPADCSGISLTEVGFRGTQANINIALATLSFKGDGSTGSPSITVSVTAAGNNYNSANGHYYKIVGAADDEIVWADAKTAAEASSYNGLSGYLVSIESAAENTFISAKVNQNAWIGGSDNSTYTSNTHATTEGTWEWVSGPNNGKTFYCQLADINNSVAAHTSCSVHADTNYNNWDNNEPNDYSSSTTGEEDCAHMKSNGKWNDFPCATANVDYYIIEYGGTDGESATVSGLTTLTINSTEASGSTFNVFDDKQLTGVIDAQAESAKRFITNSTNTILDRMENYRGLKKHKGIKFQDLNLDFDITNKDAYPYAKLLDLYLIKNDITKETKLSEENIQKFITELPLSQYLKNEFGLIPKKWKIWSSGSITKGKTKLSFDKLGKKNSSKGLTVGMDMVIKKNTLFGMAIKTNNDVTDINNLGTNIISKGRNLSIYSSWYSGNSFYLDSVLGLGMIKNSTTRITDTSNLSSKVTGERDVHQAFTNIKLKKDNYYKNLKATNHIKFDYGYNIFKKFSETGNNQALHFKEQNLVYQAISLGSSIFYDKKFNGNTFSPFLKLEFTEDFTENSKTKAYFLSNTSKTYTYDLKNSYSSFLKIKTGFEFRSVNEWNYRLNIQRLIRSNEDFENSLDLRISKVLRLFY